MLERSRVKLKKLTDHSAMFKDIFKDGFSVKALLKKIDPTFWRFLIVGVINTMVGSSTMFLLYNLAKCSYLVSSAANYIVGGICSFCLNKIFTFRAGAAEGAATGEKIRLTACQAGKFIFCVVFSYTVAYSASKYVVHHVLSMYSQEIRDNIAMFCGMCGYTMIDYIIMRFWVFRKKKEQTEEQK